MRSRIFYIIKVTKQNGYPNLNAYTHVEALAKEYARQWARLDPEIYAFCADNIIELTNNNKDYNEIMGNEFMSEDSKLFVIGIQLNSFHVKDKDKTQFIVTNQQLIDVQDGTDVMSEFTQILIYSVGNMYAISKYIKDPIFKKTMGYIFKKYITIVVLSDTLVSFDNIDMEKFSNIDTRYKYNNELMLEASTKYAELNWCECVDQYYLDYLVITNNN